MSDSPMISQCHGSAGQRRRDDRRQRSPFLAHRYWGFRGRRRRIRRASDSGRAHLDHYPPHLLVVVLGIFLLAQADTILTLLMLETGEFVEANPFMQALIDRDVHWFVNGRSLLWGLLLIALVAVASRLQYWRIRPRRVINALAVVYFAQTATMLTMLIAAG